MSFTIKLQKNNSEPNKAVKNTTDIISLTGTLKEGSSIIDPIILVDINDFTTIRNCNYMTISQFNRKYFIKNISINKNNLYEIIGHVDVLSSFWNEVKENNVILRRQQTNYNLYLNDGVFKIYQNPKITTAEFPSGFTTDEFVLALAGI